MEPITFLRMKDLSEFTGVPAPNVNRWFKTRPATEFKVEQGRITGISPAGVERFLLARQHPEIYRPGVYIFNSQTGGVSKTSSCINMAFAFARVSSRESFPIVIVDTDSQSSLTLQMMDKIRAGSRPVLVDFLEGRVKDVTEMLIDMGDNIWLVPSSLDNSYLERTVSNARKTREMGASFLQALIDRFGDQRLKVFIDTPPALSSMTHSFIMAANALDDHWDRALCIPVRPDDFAIEGCEIAIKEAEDLLDAYKETQKLRLIPFITFFDKRTSNSVVAMKDLLANPVINKHEISPVVIRTSTEITKAMKRRSTIYADESKGSPVARDYLDLMFFVMGWRNLQ